MNGNNVNVCVQVPADLHRAFLQAVEDEKATLSSAMVEMMQWYISEAEERKTPLYRASEALLAGNEDTFHQNIKKVPIPPELADSFKEIFGLQFLLDGEFNLSEAVEKYGEDWLAGGR